MSRIARLESLARHPLAGLVLVTGLTLAASGINFIVQALLAYRFGLGVEVDSYAFALSAPIFVAGLIAAIVSYTVVPLIAVENGDPARQAALCGVTLLAAGGVGLLLTGLAVPAMLFQPLVLPAGSSIAANPHLPVLIALAWLAATAQVMTAAMTAQLTACRRPVTAAMLGLFPGAGSVIALLLLAEPTIAIVAACFLAGNAAAGATGFILLRNRLTFRLGHVDVKTELASLLRKGAWAALALSCFSSFAVSDAFWASRMPEGSLASLGYVQRLIIGVGSLIVAGPSALYVPRFATFVEKGDRAGFARLLTRTLLVVLALGAAAIAVLFFQSERVVALLFRRGAFGEEDVVALAALFRVMAPGVFAMLAAVILMRALFCLKRAEVAAAALGVSWSALYFVCCGLLHRDGVLGIGRSYTIAWILIAAAIAGYTFHRIGRIAAVDREPRTA